MSTELDRLREQLTELDRKLLEIVAERQRLVEAIGRDKQRSGRATRDFERERRVIENARRVAGELGLDQDLADDLMGRLIEGSLARQESDRVRASAAGQDRRALVFGGCGKMGRWFADFLSSQEFAVTVCDPAEVECPYPRVVEWREGIDDYDLIVLASPIMACAGLLMELAELRPEAVIFDLASLKSPLRVGLRTLADAGCAVCSVHPMFGPDTRLLSGRHVILVDLGHEGALATARGLFAGTMADLTEMSLEDHDRVAAYILGLSHLLNIAFFTALRESGEASQRLSQVSSTTFDAQLQVAGKVAGENPYMYFEIQNLNDYRLAPLNALSDALARLKHLIDNGDERGFVRLMEQGRDYLASRGAGEGRT